MGKTANIVAPEKDKGFTEEERKFVGEFRGVPTSIRKWLLGLTDRQPGCLYKIMDHASNKINMVLAVLIVNRIASMSHVAEYLAGFEKDIFGSVNSKDEDGKDLLSMRDKIKLYQSGSKMMNEFLEFTRKFVGQNQEMFRHEHPADELAQLLREADPYVLKKLVHILREKGASLTEDDIGAELKKPMNPILAQLA